MVGSTVTYSIWKTKMKINNFWLIHKVYCIKYGVFFQKYLLFMHGHDSWSYVFFFFLLLLHLSIIRIWSNASLELIPNVSNYHELLLGRRACMRRLHSKGNGIMVLINLKLHLNLSRQETSILNSNMLLARVSFMNTKRWGKERQKCFWTSHSF